MTNLEFLRTILPEGNFWYVGYKNPQDPKPYFSHVPFEISETGFQAGLSFALKKPHHNVYFTPAAYLQDKTPNDSGQLTAERKRENVAALQSLWIDIDGGPGKPYASWEEVIRALGEFLRTTDFPHPSAIVRSGEFGAQALWAFNNPLPLPQWQDYANGLRKLCIESGLHIDGGVTVDAARLLRMPGTMNQKSTPAHPATLVRLTGRHPAERITKHLQTFVTPLQTVMEGGAQHLGSYQTVARNSEMSAVVKNCPLLTAIAEDGGSKCHEPLWKATLHTAKGCLDGEEWAHKLSSGHPDYSAEATVAKYEACDTEKASTITCDHFADVSAEVGYTHCGECRWRDSIKAPIQLGVTELPDTLPAHFPVGSGYYQTDKGVFRSGQKDKDGDPKDDLFIMPYVFETVELVTRYDTVTERFTPMLSCRVAHVGEKAVNTYLRVSDGASEAKWFTILAEAGMLTNNHYVKQCRDFIMAWVDSIRSAGAGVRGFDSQGWQQDPETGERFTSFVAGEKVYYPDGTVHVAKGQGIREAKDYVMRGSDEPWRELSAMLAKSNPWMAVMLASSFAAPLVAFTSFPGLVLSFQGETGVGKSLTMETAAAVWSNPTQMNQINDTPNAVRKRAGVINTMPVYWDEVRSMDERGQRNIQELIFAAVSGKDKSRLNSNAEFRETKTWNTLMTICTNASLVEIAESIYGDNSAAGLMRVFELHTPLNDTGTNVSRAEQLRTALRSNYGVIGAAYAKWLVQNSATVQGVIDKVTDDVRTRIGGKSEERLWVATISVLLVGAQFAKVLGFIPSLDVAAVKACLLETVESLRSNREEYRETKDSKRALEAYLNFISPKTLRTNVAANKGRLRSEIKITRDVVGGNFGSNNVELLAHHVEAEGVVRVWSQHLRKWLVKEGYKWRVVKKEMEEAGVFRDVGQGTMGGGTPYSRSTIDGKVGPRKHITAIHIDTHSSHLSIVPPDGTTEDAESS